jgi:hypothetical protein
VGGFIAGGSDGGDSLARGSDGAAPRTALVIDAGAGREGRELVDPRLRHADAEVRLPRTPSEARTDLRYFEAQGYRVIVAGPRAQAAARSTGVAAVTAPDLAGALAAAGR